MRLVGRAPARDPGDHQNRHHAWHRATLALPSVRRRERLRTAEGYRRARLSGPLEGGALEGLTLEGLAVEGLAVEGATLDGPALEGTALGSRTRLPASGARLGKRSVVAGAASGGESSDGTPVSSGVVRSSVGISTPSNCSLGLPARTCSM